MSNNPFDAAFDAVDALAATVDALPPFDKKPAKKAATAQAKPQPDPVPVDDDDDDAEAAKLAEFRARVDAIVDGVYFGLPAEVYHAIPRVSTSALQQIDASPADFWKDSWLDPNPTVLTEKEEKAKHEARVIGAAYHTARLEPHLFHTLYVREIDVRDYPRRGLLATDAAVKAALKELGETQTIGGESLTERAQRLADLGYPGTIMAVEEAEWAKALRGRISLSPKVFDEILIDMDRIAGAPTIAEKLTGGAAEVSVFWTDANGLKMKCRIDYLTALHWADFKTFANPRRKPVAQVIADAFRYDRYHMQSVVYRDAVEQIRVKGLGIVGDATDAERAIIAAIQTAYNELSCWYVFQQKGGVPNLLARQIEFFTVPVSATVGHAGASEEAKARVEAGARRKTQLFIRATGDVDRAKQLFMLYSGVYQPGEPWRPIEPEGTFGDIDFNRYWLDGQ